MKIRSHDQQVIVIFDHGAPPAWRQGLRATRASWQLALRVLARIWVCIVLLLLACPLVNEADGPRALTSTPSSVSLPLVFGGTPPTWWRPPVHASFQVQYADAPVDQSVVADVYDVDMFDTTADIVAALHARGRRVLGYINVGAWEDWRPDQDQFPAAVLGNDYFGWPGEKWLDIRRLDLLAPIIRARLDACVVKGFDGVDPDNINGYLNDTGFPLTYQDQLRYNIWLANEAHQRGLAIGLKNDTEQARDLRPYFDWVVTESCLAEGWCAEATPFVAEGKPVFAIEYTDTVTVSRFLNELCPQANALQLNALLKHRNLDAWRQACP